MYVNSTTLRCPNKIFKTFHEDFSICHRCQQHRWRTLSYKYLNKFSIKLETAPMRYSGAWGKLIHLCVLAYLPNSVKCQVRMNRYVPVVIFITMLIARRRKINYLSFFKKPDVENIVATSL
jgi:hypothetical protein